jgi:hypothetical protein
MTIYARGHRQFTLGIHFIIVQSLCETATDCNVYREQISHSYFVGIYKTLMTHPSLSVHIKIKK